MPSAAKLIPIVKIPDPILRQIAQPVDEITDGMRQLLDDMAATMYDAPGIGLAAPQINVSQRLVVIDRLPQQQKMLRQKRLTTRQHLLVQKRRPRPHRRRPPTQNRQPSGNWSSPQSPPKTLQRTGHRSVVVRIVMANSVMVNASNAMGNATDSAKTAREMQMGKVGIDVDAAVASA